VLGRARAQDQSAEGEICGDGVEANASPGVRAPAVISASAAAAALDPTRTTALVILAPIELDRLGLLWEQYCRSIDAIRLFGVVRSRSRTIRKHGHGLDYVAEERSSGADSAASTSISGGGRGSPWSNSQVDESKSQPAQTQ